MPFAVLLLLTAAIVIAIRQSGWQFSAPPPSAPLRFVGVRPDLGDQLFDGRGRFLREEIYDGSEEKRWSTSDLKRDFIFELDRTNAGTISAVLEVNHMDYSHNFPVEIQERSNGRKRLVGTALLPSTYRQRLLFFRPKSRPLRHVDLTLRLVEEHAETKEAYFDGPFEIGRPLTDTNGTSLTLLPPSGNDQDQERATPSKPSPSAEAEKAASASQRSLKFRLLFSLARFPDASPRVYVYDRRGKAQTLSGLRFRSRAAAGQLEFTVPNLAPDDIGSVVIPSRRLAEVTHVQVGFPELPRRTESAANAMVRTKLGITNLNRQIEIRHPREIIKVIEHLRGPLIVAAWNTLRQSQEWRTGALTPSDFSEERRAQARSAVQRWTEAANERVRLAGSGVGLWFGWKEFINPAFDLLNVDNSLARAGAMELIAEHPDCVGAEDLARLCSIWHQEENPRRWKPLLKVLPDFASRTNAASELLPLVMDERPWFWWPILKATPRHLWNSLSSPSPELAQRQWMVFGADPSVSPETASAARRTLPDLLSVRLRDEDRTTFMDVMRRVAVEAEPEPATRKVVALLREVPHPEQDNWTMKRLIQMLNRWNRTNFGGLGTDDKNPPAIAWDANQWVALLQAIEEWDQRRP